jgi:hypothetical protein
VAVHLKPAKHRSAERMDGILAMIMAIGDAMRAQKPESLPQILIFG